MTTPAKELWLTDANCSSTSKEVLSMSDETIHVSLELEPEHAAALARLCEKFAFSDAAAYLYPHIPKAIRDEQAYQMVRATSVVAEALADADVRGWPWVDTGSAR